MLCEAVSAFGAAQHRITSAFETGKLDSFGDVVLDPVLVPPLFRVDLHAVELHGEVNVIAAGHSGHAAQTHYLALLHGVALVDVNAAEMSVDSLQAVAMVDDNAIAVDTQGRGIHDFAVIRGFYAYMLRHRQVVP